MRLGVYFKTVHILIISGSKIDFFISTNQFLKSLCFTEIETEEMVFFYSYENI